MRNALAVWVRLLFVWQKHDVFCVDVAVRKSTFFSSVQLDGEDRGKYRRDFAVIECGFASAAVDFDKHGDADDLLYARFRLAK